MDRSFLATSTALALPVGNVWQWTADDYASDTYARAAASGGIFDPRDPETGTTRVLGGGSWWCGGVHVRG